MPQRITKQNFYAIKRDIKANSKDLEQIAVDHKVSISTIRLIARCRTWLVFEEHKAARNAQREMSSHLNGVQKRQSRAGYGSDTYGGSVSSYWLPGQPQLPKKRSLLSRLFKRGNK